MPQQLASARLVNCACMFPKHPSIGFRSAFLACCGWHVPRNPETRRLSNKPVRGILKCDRHSAGPRGRTGNAAAHYSERVQIQISTTLVRYILEHGDCAENAQWLALIDATAAAYRRAPKLATGVFGAHRCIKYRMAGVPPVALQGNLTAHTHGGPAS